ncbi:MAG TPA: hypothetical protein ENJ08_12830 [Gammaproteobacteria bacterium]|nr:hypothetical protein [Gammaproteobacteria bacterium]
MHSLQNIICRLSLVFVMFFTPLASFAATYYVSASASGDSGSGTLSSPKKYITSGLALMSSSGGDTLVVMPGTYADANDRILSSSVPNGQPGAYNIIKAQTDGTVTIDASFNLSAVGAAQSSYLQFEGLKWRGPTGKSIVGHHIKILRCAFEGGPSSGNTTTFGIGTNNQTPGATDILIEDSWFYGEGGRYEMLIFNSDRVILRRVVARHDGGWCFNVCGGSGPPEAGVTVYNSKNILLQNVMVLDSNLIYQYWESTFYIINNTALLDNDNTVVDGALSINNRGVSFKFDGPKAVTNAVIQDSVSYGLGDGTGFGIALTGNPGSNSTLRNLTLMNAGTGVLVGSSATTNDLTNSILEGNTRAIMDNSGPGSNWTHSFNNCSNNNNNNCNSTGETSYNARNNGLLYPVRIETGSTLDSAGINGATVGATILFKLGVSGSLYNDTGARTTTSESLWPWPSESRMKTDMCDEISTGVADRGWCASNKTLTQYIWELLGNTIPGSLSPMASPSNARSVKN